MAFIIGGMIVAALGVALACKWFVFPALRKHAWWNVTTAYLWALAGNSKTIAVALAVEVLALADEAKAIDLSALFGAERGGRIAAVMGVVMIVLRLVTKRPASFTPASAEVSAGEPAQTREPG
jgi:hypothetical protein